MNLPPTKEVMWFRRQLRNWFAEHQRSFPWREECAGDYLRVLSEVLLQRTRAEVVATFLPSFVKLYPSWQVIAMSTVSQLGKHLRPIGLWRRKAVSLKRLANEMV